MVLTEALIANEPSLVRIEWPETVATVRKAERSAAASMWDDSSACPT